MLTSVDDYVHPVGTEPNFNESMYFHFHDARSAIGGFVRLANRPNEGRGERTVCLYLPDGSVAFGFVRPEFPAHSQFRAGGLSVESIEPFQRLRVTFDGSVHLLNDPAAMIDPKAALSVSPVVDCTVLFNLSALAPPYAETFDGDGESFAPNHYEQLMRVAGTINLGDRTFAVAGHGLRDHSWGPRSWQAPWFYRWVHGSAAGLGFMGAYFGDRDGGFRTGGFVWDGERLHRCSEVALSTVRNSDHQIDEVTVRLASPEREWTFTGQVRSAVPLRHRTAEGANATRILEATLAWTDSAGARLNGMAEYLDQIIDDVPVGMHV